MVGDATNTSPERSFEPALPLERTAMKWDSGPLLTHNGSTNAGLRQMSRPCYILYFSENCLASTTPLAPHLFPSPVLMWGGGRARTESNKCMCSDAMTRKTLPQVLMP